MSGFPDQFGWTPKSNFNWCILPWFMLPRCLKYKTLSINTGQIFNDGGLRKLTILTKGQLGGTVGKLGAAQH